MREDKGERELGKEDLTSRGVMRYPDNRCLVCRDNERMALEAFGFSFIKSIDVITNYPSSFNRLVKITVLHQGNYLIFFHVYYCFFLCYKYFQ